MAWTCSGSGKATLETVAGPWADFWRILDGSLTDSCRILRGIVSAINGRRNSDDFDGGKWKFPRGNEPFPPHRVGHHRPAAVNDFVFDVLRLSPRWSLAQHLTMAHDDKEQLLYFVPLQVPTRRMFVLFDWLLETQFGVQRQLLPVNIGMFSRFIHSITSCSVFAFNQLWTRPSINSITFKQKVKSFRQSFVHRFVSQWLILQPILKKNSTNSIKFYSALGSFFAWTCFQISHNKFDHLW